MKAQEEPFVRRLCDQIGSCLHEDAARPPVPTGDGGTSPTRESIVIAVFYVWNWSLEWLVESSGNRTLTSARLDESMLPIGLTDGLIVSLSDGLTDGPTLRAVLKRLKASLPEGALLPEDLVEMLAMEGIVIA